MIKSKHIYLTDPIDRTLHARKATADHIKQYRGNGWTIINTALNLHTTITMEYDRTHTRTVDLGIIQSHSKWEGLQPRYLLYILEFDRFTPRWVHDAANYLTSPNKDSYLVRLEWPTKMV